MSKDYCSTCGGEYDRRFETEPCPECGRTYGGFNVERRSPEELQALTTKLEDLCVPPQYAGIPWNREIILKDKRELTSDLHFKHFISQLEKINSLFRTGVVPAKSAFISAPPGFSKLTWAYSCMQEALAHNHTVAPILDTREVKRLLILASEKPWYKLYGKIMYDDYIMSDVCFITVTKTEYFQEAYQIILEILDVRARKGLPTFIISRFDLESISKRDFAGHTRELLNRSNNADVLKYASLLSYYPGV